ncbi:MAG: ferredoxin [Acidimicrobiia bacterium]|nr:ferredoxin [Acidimicrobiia bacterium]MYL08657.1 ferredoxin [Acidimicrobiia bacterium]
MRVSVDDDVCGGHGVCTVLCPEVFVLEDAGYARAAVEEVPDKHEAAVREAEVRCPTRAIRVD